MQHKSQRNLGILAKKSINNRLICRKFSLNSAGSIGSLALRASTRNFDSNDSSVEASSSSSDVDNEEKLIPSDADDEKHQQIRKRINNRRLLESSKSITSIMTFGNHQELTRAE